MSCPTCDNLRRERDEALDLARRLNEEYKQAVEELTQAVDLIRRLGLLFPPEAYADPQAEHGMLLQEWRAMLLQEERR